MCTIVSRVHETDVHHTCGRCTCVRRESDKARHKCVEEKRKPVSEQAGHEDCGRWMMSRGGLAMHRSRRGRRCQWLIQEFGRGG